VQPRLFSCLLGSMLVGAMAAGLALASGWGWLAAVAVYSLGGSAVLVGLSLGAVALTDREAGPGPELQAHPARPYRRDRSSDRVLVGACGSGAARLEPGRNKVAGFSSQRDHSFTVS
jgi:hypothetical protein